VAHPGELFAVTIVGTLHKVSPCKDSVAHPGELFVVTIVGTLHKVSPCKDSQFM